MTDQPVAHPETTPSEVTTRPAERLRVGVLAVAIAVVQVLLVMLFAWAASRQAPHELPIAVAGPPQQVAAVTAGIEHAKPGAFDLTVVADDAAARQAVTSRDAYGALVLGSAGVTLYTAPAASNTVAAALAQSIPAVVAQADPQAQVTVTPLVPNPPDDPNGQGLPISLIPLTITSIAAGAALTLLTLRRAARIAGLVGYAVVAGVLSTWALQSVLGVLTGSWLANAAVLTLVCLAVAAGTAGLAALLGAAGVALAAVVVFFFGFPFSGATTAWQLVPTPWGQIAQYLPVGAANTAVRSVAYFSGSGSAAALGVLVAWAAVGLLLAGLLRGRRHARRAS